MVISSIKVTITPRWWLLLYLAGVSIASQVSGNSPDPEKLAYWIERGVVIKLER